METIEHTDAGNQIMFGTSTDNPYLSGGRYTNSNNLQPLKLNLMRLDDGLPSPSQLELTAGQVVALAGDYYTHPGWGNVLQLPNITGAKCPYQQSAEIDVSSIESNAFEQSYQALSLARMKDIEKIYQLEKDYEQNPTAMKQYLNQLRLQKIIPQYLSALKNNTAHFSPWSTRAYLVGHHRALHYARVANQLKRLADGHITLNDVNEEVGIIYHKIRKKSGNFKTCSRQAMLKEYHHRYYTLAVSMDLSAMHYYSDHFASGHLSRLGLLRTEMAKQFGLAGQLLVNSMHNEDNHLGVQVTHGERHAFSRPFRHTLSVAHGDGKYHKSSNDSNANNMLNGMTASLGEIYQVANATDDKQIHPKQYLAATTFLPRVDDKAVQYEPMFVLTPKGEIFYRKDLTKPQMISAKKYQRLLQAPEKFPHRYASLSLFDAWILVIKTRIFGTSANVESINFNSAPEEDATLEDSYQMMYKKGMSLSSSSEDIDELEKVNVPDIMTTDKKAALGTAVENIVGDNIDHGDIYCLHKL